MIKNKIICVFFLFSLFIPFVNAEYLGNFKFDIQDTGTVLIEGQTNYEPFNIKQIETLTSKNKEYWTFDLNTPIFSEYYYSIVLPKNTIINHIQSTNTVRITYLKDRMNVIATGANENIQIKIQYSSKKNILTDKDWNWIIYVSILVILIPILLYIFKKKKKNKSLNNIIYSELNDRQKEIINILKKEKKVTQNYLQKKLNIPKASTSRNLKSLENKEIIEIKKFGLTNTIYLKK